MNIYDKMKVLSNKYKNKKFSGTISTFHISITTKLLVMFTKNFYRIYSATNLGYNEVIAKLLFCYLALTSNFLYV